MATVRQRIPFRFSEDEEQDQHVLDEQEQEEVIDRLRQESASSNAMYLVGLQLVVGLSLLLHVLCIARSSQGSPLAIMLRHASARSPMPLASAFTLLQLLIHCNLGIHTLHHSHPLRSAAQVDTLLLLLPLPLSHPFSVFAPAVAPIYAFIIGEDWIDILWWSITGCLTILVAVVLKWIKQEEEDIAALERLRYVARGA